MNSIATLNRNAPASVVVRPETMDLMRASKSPNTLRAYKYALIQLDRWLDSRPLTDELLAEYITERHEAGKSPNTIGAIVAAAKWSANLHNLPDVAGRLTKTTLQGIRREGRGRGRGRVTGLRRMDVKKICWKAAEDGDVIALRDSAILQLMSDCLLRISELSAVNVDDVKDTPDGEGTLYIKESKTDQLAEGTHLFISKKTMSSIKAYCEAAGINEGALFRGAWRKDMRENDRISVNAVRRMIKKRASAARIDGFVSGHSLRVGMAVSMASKGATVVQMQNRGRWQSPSMPAHYAASELELANVDRKFYAWSA